MEHLQISTMTPVFNGELFIRDLVMELARKRCTSKRQFPCTAHGSDICSGWWNR